MWESEKDFLETLLADGSIVALTGEGEDAVVTWDMQVLEVMHPEIFEQVRAVQLEEVEQALNSLAEKGMVNMGFEEQEDGSLEEVWSLTELGQQVAEASMLGDLTDQD